MNQRWIDPIWTRWWETNKDFIYKNKNLTIKLEISPPNTLQKPRSKKFEPALDAANPTASKLEKNQLQPRKQVKTPSIFEWKVDVASWVSSLNSREQVWFWQRVRISTLFADEASIKSPSIRVLSFSRKSSQCIRPVSYTHLTLPTKRIV